MPPRYVRLSWLTVLISCNVALFILSLSAIGRIYLYERPRQTVLDVLLNRSAEPQLIDYKDFISIMLTGLGLMITVLGICLATIAIWGFSTIRDDAKKAAENISREATTEAFFKLARERLSAAEASAKVDKISSVPVETVQSIVDALTRGADDGGPRG